VTAGIPDREDLILVADASTTDPADYAFTIVPFPEPDAGGTAGEPFTIGTISPSLRGTDTADDVESAFDSVVAGSNITLSFDNGVMTVEGTGGGLFTISEATSLAALQATADAVETAGGGTVGLRAGTYTLEAGDLDLDRSVFLAGAGSEGTVLQAAKTALTSGTATGGSASTLADTGKSWTTNEWADKYVEITSGTGSGQIRKVVSNTATVLTPTPNWAVAPSTDSVYKVYTPTRILVTGTGNWRHKISELRIDGIDVIYGNTSGDYGNGCAVVDCEVQNAYYGVLTRYNTWLHKIIACEIHNCCFGVYYDFAAPTSGAGAAMRLVASDVFNCYHAMHVEATTADGFHVIVEGSNLENNDHSGLFVNLGSDGAEGTIDLTDTHFELNDVYNIYCASTGDGLTIHQKGGWAFVASPAIHARVGTYCRLFIGGNIRLQWDAEYLFELDGGQVVIDSDQSFTNNAFFGKGSAKMASAGSSGSSGRIWNGGPAYDGRRGKVMAGQVTQDHDLPTGGASQVVSTIQPYDASVREWRFVLTVTAAASASQIFRVYANPGTGGGFVDFFMPLATGSAVLRVTYDPVANRLALDGIFVTSANVPYVVDTSAALSHAISVQKTVEFASVSASGTEAAMYARRLFEYVH
jgi:hypothetical protein